jgi:molybdenum cofactor biosynthesis enzyme MoaA
MSYTCNFSGLQNINIHIESMNTDNIDSLTKSSTNIIQSVPVDCNQSQIIFKKTVNFEFTVKEEVTTIINITLNDDLGQPIDFNNQHWNMTLQFNTFFDLDRFNHNFSFKHILRNGYT